MPKGRWEERLKTVELHEVAEPLDSQDTIYKTWVGKKKEVVFVTIQMSCRFVCLGVFFRELQDSSGDRQLQVQLRMTVSAPLFKRCGSKEEK